MQPITIKNGGKIYTLELPDSPTGLQLKQAIHKQVGIAIDRQKILVKGGITANDIDCQALLELSKQPIMVLGSINPLPTASIPIPVFSEDFAASQMAVSNEPLGLFNLGNTCYLNATLQAIFAIENVRTCVLEQKPKQGTFDQDPNALICNSLKTVFGRMKNGQAAVSPALFLTVFRNIFPQFAERGEGGMFKQQDAEEAFTQLMGFLNRKYDLEDLFRIDFNILQKCLASTDEPIVEKIEKGMKLNCHIDIKTNFLRDGILAGLTERIEKYLDILSADTTFEITRTITRLPKYLTVQFVRFFWKRNTQKKSKILRRVQFPFELDVSEMLHDLIKTSKVQARDAIRLVEKELLELIREFNKKQKTQDNLNPVEQQEVYNVSVASIREKFQADVARTFSDIPNLSSTTQNPLLVYELLAVITHAGALADLGHYQAFIKDTTDLDGDRWWKFNDEKVSAVPRERIQQLAGGGESDSALILVYKAVGL